MQPRNIKTVPQCHGQDGHHDRDLDKATPPHLLSSGYYSLSHPVKTGCAHNSPKTLYHPVMAQSVLTQVTDLLAFIADLDSTSPVAAQPPV